MMRARERLVWRHWDDEDEYVVYNPTSGDSHLLDFLTAQGLMRLEQHPMTAAELVADLSAHLDIAADKSLDAYVRRFLDELFDLGLTYRVET